ncbi:hypothetical protein PISMIDRAFT_13358 [Pisolithus microcarpus 441]|uniref:Uncharacterized protein n=1 Tax=Pisolithus microcarpus 441 TaxID=765257 RepID=A0A0C9YT45_9AGAM|nr:hypothetical protein PISMIDRAFT_13358 [Pisolithus microcarpus 441]
MLNRRGASHTSVIEEGTGVNVTQASGEHEEGDDDLDVVTLMADKVGNIVSKCQVMDYKFCSDVLERDNGIDFFLNSYEVTKTPCHNHVDYQPGHTHVNQKHRIIRRLDHHNLPNFIGWFFPSQDDPEQYPFYCASMLLLLKPWRNLATDLKRSSETWETVFKVFLTQAPLQVHRILSGIQYFHQCERSVQEWDTVDIGSHVQSPPEQCAEDVDLGEMSGGILSSSMHPLNEQDLHNLISSQIPRAKEMHGHLALEAARFAGIFQSSDCAYAEELLPSHESQCLQFTVHRAQPANFNNLSGWQDQMSRDVIQQNTSAHPHPPSSSGASTAADVYLINEEEIHMREEQSRSMEMSEVALCPVDPSILNVGQTHAYKIVTWHVDQTLSGHTPPPL